MTPYWCNEQHDLSIYLGDCLEVMPALGRTFDLCLADPPYGIDLGGDGCNPRNEDRRIHGDDGPFDPTPLLHFPAVVLWGGNNFADHLPRGGWFVWDKRVRNDKSDLANQCDAELAWTNTTSRILVFRHLWSGAFRASEFGQPAIHPTQKPVALMKWCIEKAGGDARTVLDPFLGSGTTLVACHRLGRAGVGIEISEEYCALAARRLEQEIAQGRLFEPAEIAAPQQMAMV